MSVAEQYARDVLSGKIVAGRLIKLAAERFLKDLERKDIYFDESEANKFVNFAQNHCRLWEDKWRGEPIVLEPWMCFFLQQIFGWFYTATKLRRVRKVYVQVAKKNAKSTLSAVLALYYLFADERSNTPKIFIGANNEEQARIACTISGRIVEQSPDLYDYVDDGTVQLSNYGENITRVIHKGRDGFIKPMAKEPEGKDKKQSGGKHGFNPLVGIIDEYSFADGPELLETLETAQAARREPLMFIITTAGHKQSGPCFTKLRRTGIEIMEGVMEDDGYLAFIWEMDKGDLIYDETKWIKSNPNIGVSVFKDFLKSQATKAKNEGGSTEVNIRTLNFNEWCETPEVWISKEVWDTNTHRILEDELIGKECFGSIHIISQKELGAFCLLFPNIRENVHAVKMIFWMPSKYVIDNNAKIDFGRWTDQGHIITCPGNAIDNYFIFDSIWNIIRKYEMHSLSFPVNMESHDIVQALIQNEIECNPISQGYRAISEPTTSWESHLTKGEIEHFNNPVLAWTNSNCMIKRNGDDIKMERAGARTAGVVACINALAQWKTVLANEEEAGFDIINL